MSLEQQTRRRGRPANPQTRGRILAAAVELFAEQGFDKTSVSEVVARAGVTKGALYHYFPAKDDLLFESYRDIFGEQKADLERILGSQRPAPDKLRAVIDSLVLSAASEAPMFSVFSREVTRLGDQRWSTLQAEWRAYQDGVRALVREAQRAGTFGTATSPQTVSWIIFGYTNALPTWYRPDGPRTAQQISRELADFVLAGLGTGTVTPADTPREDHHA